MLIMASKRIFDCTSILIDPRGSSRLLLVSTEGPQTRLLRKSRVIEMANAGVLVLLTTPMF
jgi:hypothetical protein